MASRHDYREGTFTRRKQLTKKTETEEDAAMAGKTKISQLKELYAYDFPRYPAVKIRLVCALPRCPEYRVIS